MTQAEWRSATKIEIDPPPRGSHRHSNEQHEAHDIMRFLMEDNLQINEEDWHGVRRLEIFAAFETKGCSWSQREESNIASLVEARRRGDKHVAIWDAFKS